MENLGRSVPGRTIGGRYLTPIPWGHRNCEAAIDRVPDMGSLRRIRLDNTFFEGKNNAYVIEGAEPIIFDPGIVDPDTRQQLEAGLGESGLKCSDIEHVFLTHWHQDHAGLAGEVQSAGGATVYVHPADAPLIRLDRDARDDLQALRLRRTTEWGIPTDKREEILSIFHGPTLQSAVDETVTIDEGDEIRIHDTVISVIHSPGHAEGHCCFEVSGDFGEVLLTGDTLLPVYTPNVGGADVRVDRPLARYVATLRDLIERDPNRALPGHRDPITDPAGRAETILTHHEARAFNVLSALLRNDLEWVDPWKVSEILFGELEGIHIIHGPGEAFAHLDHLAHQGALEREDSRYRLTAKTIHRLEMTDQERWPLTKP